MHAKQRVTNIGDGKKLSYERGQHEKLLQSTHPKRACQDRAQHSGKGGDYEDYVRFVAANCISNHHPFIDFSKKLSCDAPGGDIESDPNHGG